MNVPGQERWAQLWRGAGLAGDPRPWRDRLIQAYSEPHRQYHDLRHLAECLAEFDPARALARQPAAVELAIWFHDAVYEPRAQDNEARSADWAVECLSGAGASAPFVESVRRLVYATKDHQVSMDPDAPVLVDVDLSILGQPSDRFDEYERQTRAEYAWVPETVFAKRRAEILEGFLARKRIYRTGWFSAKYEVTARANLERSLRRLKNAAPLD